MVKLAAGSTYTPIATTTLGSAAASYTFSSIPSTYTDLIIVCSVSTTSGSAGIAMQVGNGSVDTGSNYSGTYLSGTNYGGSQIAKSVRETSVAKIYISEWAGVALSSPSPVIIHFQNYANTTTYKTVLIRFNTQDNASGYNEVNAGVGLWRSTSAINTISIQTTASTFTAGSTFTLFGIASA